GIVRAPALGPGGTAGNRRAGPGGESYRLLRDRRRPARLRKRCSTTPPPAAPPPSARDRRARPLAREQLASGAADVLRGRAESRLRPASAAGTGSLGARDLLASSLPPPRSPPA